MPGAVSSCQADAAPDGDAICVSVIILTFNEEKNIADCLRSCARSDDIHVLDSGSTDRTIEIARSFGVTIHQHPFTTFGQQRNWAIDHVPTRHEWLFHLDADERFTPALTSEIASRLSLAGDGDKHAAYLVPSKMMFGDRWLARSGMYPVYQARLLHRGHCRFIDVGHGQREQTSGSLGTLCEAYVHLPFSRGFADWLQRHDRYSDADAEHARLQRQSVCLGDVFSPNRVQRWRAMRTIAHRLHGRAAWRFAYQYLWRRGCLDGQAGLAFCLMMAMYESWVELKQHGQTPAAREQIQRLVHATRRYPTAHPLSLIAAELGFHAPLAMSPGGG